MSERLAVDAGRKRGSCCLIIDALYKAFMYIIRCAQAHQPFFGF